MRISVAVLAGLVVLASGGCQPAASGTADGPPAGYVSQDEYDQLQERFDALLAEHHARSEVEELEAAQSQILEMEAELEKQATTAPKSTANDNVEFAGFRFSPVRATRENPAFAGWEYECIEKPNVRMLELRQWQDMQIGKGADTFADFKSLELISRSTQVRKGPSDRWIKHGLSITWYPRGNSMSFYEMGEDYTGVDSMGVAIPPRDHEWDYAERLDR